MLFRKHNHQNKGIEIQKGFTLIEALIATAVMLIIVASTVRIFTYLSASFLLSRQRDAIQSLLLNDISNIRRLVKSYCLIPHSGTLQACSGAIVSQDWSGSYNPDDKVDGDCDQNRLATAMVAANPTQFPSSQVLNTTGGSAGLLNVIVTRTLSAQGNELLINYTTTSGSKIVVRTNTTLVPPALGWCP